MLVGGEGACRRCAHSQGARTRGLVPAGFLGPKPSLQPVPLPGPTSSLPAFLRSQRSLVSSLSSGLFCTCSFASTGPPPGLSLFFSQRELSVLKTLLGEAGRRLLFFQVTIRCAVCAFVLSGMQHKYNCIEGITYSWAWEGGSVCGCGGVRGGDGTVPHRSKMRPKSGEKQRKTGRENKRTET